MASARARELRKNMTPQEVKLWLFCVPSSAYKAGNFAARRHPRLHRRFRLFRGAANHKVDGSQHGHEDGLKSDRVRDEVLRRGGFEVARFWNVEVDREFDGVCHTITEMLLNAELRLRESENAVPPPTQSSR